MGEVTPVLLDTAIDEHISVEEQINLIERFDESIIGKIKTSIEEYLFHLKNETDDFELLHQATMVCFIGNMLKQPYRFMVSIDAPKHNEDNVMVGI